MLTQAGRARSRPLRVPSRRSWSCPVGADGHRRHPQLLVVNSGYLQRRVHRPSCYIQCAWQQFVLSLCVQHTYQSVGGREGAGSIGKHLGGGSEKGNGSWLDRDGHGTMESIAEAGAAWLWVVSAGCALSFAPTRVVHCGGGVLEAFVEGRTAFFDGVQARQSGSSRPARLSASFAFVGYTALPVRAWKGELPIDAVGEDIYEVVG